MNPQGPPVFVPEKIFPKSEKTGVSELPQLFFHKDSLDLSEKATWIQEDKVQLK